MKLQTLEYFMAVAREGSLSAAAKYLRLSQPALSRQLRELEGELGLALKPGARLLGNFYKRSRDPEKSHDGSCWPADFAGGREYGLGSLTEFTVVSY